MKYLDLTKKNVYFIFFITLFTCFLVNSGSLISSDAAKRLQVTHWLWTNAPQVVPGATDIAGPDGKQYAQWGVGQSLLMLPADVVGHAITVHFHASSLRNQAQVAIVSYLTFPLLNAIVAVLAYLLLLELKFTETTSVLGTIALVFGTTFLPYAQIEQENSLIFFALIGGFLGNIRWLRTHKIRHLCFGVFCLGWSLLVRVPCIFDAFTVGMFVVISILYRNQDGRKKIIDLVQYAALFGLFYLPFVLADRFYQWLRFGSFKTTYFAIQMQQARAADPTLPQSYPYTTPMLHGLTGFLFSPAKSIFLFNPLLIVVVILVIHYRKSLDRCVLQFFGLGCFLLLADMCMYSRLVFWGGDAAWGPRYVVTPSQLIALLAVPIFIKTYPLIKYRFEKTLCLILLASGCFVQIIGILYQYNLELFQENNFHVKYFIVGQRLLNIIALSMGTFQRWGLDPGFAAQGDQNLITLAFMPWHTTGQMPHAVSRILQSGWVAGCITLLIILLVFFIQIRKKILRTHSDISITK